MNNIDSDTFLSICSEILGDGVFASGLEKYNELYGAVNNSILKELHNSSYDNAPAIQRAYNGLLDLMENVLVVPEINGKNLVHIKNCSTKKFFELISRCGEIETDTGYEYIDAVIPAVIIPSTESNVEIINKKNQRISLSVDELELFMKGCKTNSINVYNLINLIIIKALLPEGFSCVLLGNSNPLSELTDDVYEVKQHSSSVEIYDAMRESGSRHYYGFKERFLCIEQQILGFFQRNIAYSKKIQQILTDDIVRTGSGDSNMLKEVRTDENARQRQYEDEEKKYNRLFESIRECKNELINQIGDKYRGRCSESLLDTIYRMLFDCVEENNTAGIDKCMKYLECINYGSSDDEASLKLKKLTEQYVEFVKDKQLGNVSDMDMDETLEWYGAKMLFAMCNVEKLSKADEETLLDAIGENITSGKELYYASSAATDELRDDMLFESMFKGYKKAGEELYYNSDNKDAKKFVLNSLNEATIIDLCENEDIEIDSQEMFLCKMLAARGNTRCLQIVADKLFAEYFKDLFQIDKDTDEDTKKSGYLIIKICENLLGNNVSPSHNREMLGATRYCMRQDYSSAMDNLSGITSDTSYFCRGKMYMNGYGVGKDYDKALYYFSKMTPGNVFDSSSLIEIVKEMKAADKAKRQAELKANDASEYSSKLDYSSKTQTYYSVNSGGCFITTAACLALKAGDNCDELNTIRGLRDNYINLTDEGQALVAEYYRIGPKIVEGIDASDNPESIYLEMWNSYIKPTYDLIMQNKLKEATEIYISMVSRLSEKYDIAVKSNIVNLIKEMQE